MWRKKRNKCGYWLCNRRISDDAILCQEHLEQWINGLIDRCPTCARFKDIMFNLCSDCYYGRKIIPLESSVTLPPQKRIYQVEYTDTETNVQMEGDKHFVYILEFDGGDLSVGHTKDLRKKLAEYRMKYSLRPSICQTKRELKELLNISLRKKMHSLLPLLSCLNRNHRPTSLEIAVMLTLLKKWHYYPITHVPAFYG